MESEGILLPSLAPADTIELAVALFSIGKYYVMRAKVSGPIADMIIAWRARIATRTSYESVMSSTRKVRDVKIRVEDRRYRLLIVSVSFPAMRPPIAFGIV